MQMRGFTFGVALLLSITACQAQSRKSPHCLSYEPAVVSVSGTLVRATFPGPPNYEDIDSGDMPETPWLVKLSREVCVNEDKANPDLNPRQQSILLVQLVIAPKDFEGYRTLIGKRVVAKGTLFGAHTGHHHTPVLLRVSDLARAGGGKS